MVHHSPNDDNCLRANARWFRHYVYTGFRDCLKVHRPEHVAMKPFDYLSFFQVFVAKLVLEVCGAAGAIWGCSEFLTLRTPENSDSWRIVSLTVFGIFLVRFWWHAKHHLEHEREFPPIKLKHRRLHKVSFSQIFSAKLVLELLGAAGAIWGPSDALTLRTAENIEKWRIVSCVALGLAGLRWVLQIFTYCLCFVPFMKKQPNFTKILAWCEVLFVRFLLVVLGAIGAVWGFSEIVTLRTPETNYIWRPVSLVFGAIFFVRWILQTIEYGLGLWDEDTNSMHNSDDDSLHSSGSIQHDDNDNDDGIKDLELSENPGLTSKDTYD